MKRRRFTTALGAAVAASVLPRAHAQQNVLKILVGFPPSPAGFDFIARQVANQLPALTGKTAVVDNRVGASGRIALEAIKNSRPDGESIILSSQSPLTIFPHIYSNLRFDPVGDFTPITRATTFDYTVTVGPNVPVKNIREFLTWAKGESDKAAFASPGAGTTPHFLGEAMNLRLGTKTLHVPYKGGAPAMLDVVSGQVPMTYDTVSAGIEQHRAGKVRILATMGSKRSPLLPDVPTLKEVGVDLEVYGWCGFYGPAGMERGTVEALNKSLSAALMQDSVRAALERIGMSPAPCSPAELADLQRRERDMWGPVIAASGFKAES
jgi:tripartite-type tricarboxylate transporter receptor subunit TctC